MSSTGIEHVAVAAGEEDQRLDRWLRRRYPHVPQGLVERLCRRGEIRVDGGRVKPATRLQEGQTVRVPPLPARATTPAVPRAGADISAADAEMIRAAVIYRDADVIALNKPPGLAVQGGSGTLRHVDGLAEAFDEFLTTRGGLIRDALR